MNPSPTPIQPLCFVLMPYGRKQDGTGRLVDFDAVYQQIIAPGIVAAGLEPIRADEEQVGGTIHKPMYERLMLCEFAVADVTGASPNVYYELGIRHAIRPRCTLILFAAGSSASRPPLCSTTSCWRSRAPGPSRRARRPR